MDMPSKGATSNVPTAAPQIAPQQNALQQFAQMAQQPQPVQQAPAQFNGPSGNGQQLTDFLKALMQNRGAM